MKPAPSELLQNEDDAPGAPLWRRHGATAVAVVLLLAALVWSVRSLSQPAGSQARQVARIAILPDTPPPPPPSPPERKPEAPRLDAKAAPTPDPQPKPDTPPADAPIKMEGPAGTGPSAFAAGAVTNDYIGGAPQVGGAAAAAAPADRAAERLYANSVKQALQREIERQLDADAGEFGANFAVWIGGDGRIDRWSLDPGNDPPREAALRAALERSADALRLPPPPPSAVQPLRYRLTVRASG